MRPARFGLSRTALAAILVVVAVALPIITWLTVGGRLVGREAELERSAVITRAYEKGLKLSSRIASRLAELQTQEEDRSFSEYQNVRHDPDGAASGVAVTVSPLARGPVSKDIRMHFQVDEDGRLTLPTVNEQIPELGMESSADCAAIHALEDIAIYASQGIALSEYCPLGENALPPPVVDTSGEMAIHHVEELNREAWRQHLQANALYLDLKRRKPKSGLFQTATPGDQRVYVPVGPFDWYTLPVEDEPGLVALRAVETPEGTWLQGFVVDHEEIARSLENDSFPARFVPQADRTGGKEANTRARDDDNRELLVSVEGSPWAVVLDIAPAMAEVGARSANERRGFLQVVLMVAAAAGLAGVLIIALVHQTERLANQRAQFAASAAHELRTPLAGLRLYGEMLAEGMGDPARARQYAHRLAGEAERLGRVVSNVLSFTRLERSMLSVDTHQGDLGARVREVMERLQPTLEGAGIDLELAINEVPPVLFDRDAVGHIVQNLVDNAEKYTRDVEARKVRVEVSSDDQSVSVSVADNGPGVARSLRRRLFRPFARGENTGSAEGLGLGLVLVRALAQAQGASVRYQDAPGGGARFDVRFVRAEPEPA